MITLKVPALVKIVLFLLIVLLKHTNASPGLKKKNRMDDLGATVPCEFKVAIKTCAMFELIKIFCFQQ